MSGWKAEKKSDICPKKSQKKKKNQSEKRPESVQKNGQRKVWHMSEKYFGD